MPDTRQRRKFALDFDPTDNPENLKEKTKKGMSTLMGHYEEWHSQAHGSPRSLVEDDVTIEELAAKLPR